MSRQDVENGEKQWVESFNAGDAAGVAAMYTREARLMAPNMPIITGPDEMVPVAQDFIDSGAKLAFQLIKVYETPDLCVAVGAYDMTFPGTATPPDRGKFVEVWTRQPDGEWRIADDIFNSDLPPIAV